MKSSPKTFDRRITLSRKDKQKIHVSEELMRITSFLTKKSLNKCVLELKKNRNRRKSVFIFILKEFNSDIAAEQ